MATSSKFAPRLFPSVKLKERLIRDEESGPHAQHLHLKPVWTVLVFLIPCVLLTLYYAQYGVGGGGKTDSILPSPSYAFVLFLVYLDVVGLVVLTLLLSRNLIKAYFEKRHRLFGSGFRTKLIAAFIGFSLVPTVLLAFVASGVINEVMKVWFNNHLEEVLNDSKELATLYHERQESLAVKSAQAISQEIYREDFLQPNHRELLMAVMTRKRAELDLSAIEVFSPKLETLARIVDPALPEEVFGVPVGQLVLDALEQGELTSVQVARVGRLIRAAVPVSSNVRSGGVDGVVVVNTYIPESFVTKMEGITRQHTDFLQIKALENPIKLGAYLFVAMVTVLLLFSATWFGFYVAQGITVPIQKLAEGTEAVARGELNVRVAVNATDEIGTLVDSFNDMTTDLASSKDALMRSNVDADRRRAYMEAVVETIASGVLSIDTRGIVTRFNHSAERILGVGADAVLGSSASDVCKSHQFTLFQEAYDRILLDGRESLTIEGQMDVQGKLLTIGLNLSRMRDKGDQDLGFVLVFEDRTELIKAQKTAAWQEVAQRIAHEIKNPLTPIQLSAQRLRKKFFENAPDFQGIFDQSTSVIVSEVGSLKRMVDEFSNFARMPAPHVTKESLHDVIENVAALYRGGHHDVDVTLSLDAAVPPINLDREQMHRVFVNLFDNAIQAMKQKGRIQVSTEMEWKHQRVRITVADEGPGIRQEDQVKLFVPYFSKNRRGSGLGLAIIHRIVTDHSGTIQVANRRPRGARFSIELPIA